MMERDAVIHNQSVHLSIGGENERDHGGENTHYSVSLSICESVCVYVCSHRYTPLGFHAPTLHCSPNSLRCDHGP